MTQNKGRLRYLAIVVLALAVGLAACGQIQEGDTITGLLVSPSDVALKVGSDRAGTAQLTAAIQYASGATVDAEVNWESNKPEIATVSAEGLVTAVGAGEASVTATAKTNPELSGTANITVAPAGTEGPGGGDGDPISVVLDRSSLALVRTQTWVLSAVVTGADEGEDGVTWNTSNAAAVSITHEGNQATLTATGTGEATITATSDADPSASASATVNVTALEIAIGFVFDPPVVGQGEAGELTATISNGNPDVDLGVTWSVGSPALMQLDETASTSGDAITFTADGVGTVTVTATSVQDPQVKTTQIIEIVSAAVDPMNVYVGGPVRIPGTGDVRTGSRFNPFKTIQEGVDAVAVGGTVHVNGNRELSATLNINKDDITVLGEAGHTISPAGSFSGTRLIVIPSGFSGVTLDSLNLEVLSSSASVQQFVFLDHSTDITIKNSTFTGDWNAGAGVRTTAIRVVIGSTPWDLDISGNTFDDVEYPASFYGSAGHRGEVHTSITNNHAIGTKSWLLFGVPEGVKLNGNTFDDSVCASATAVQITFGPEGSAPIDNSYLTHIEAISIANDDAYVRYLPNDGGPIIYAGTPCYTGP